MRPGDWLWRRLGAEKPPNRVLDRALNRGAWPAGAALVWVVLSLLAALVLFHPAFNNWLLRSAGGTDPQSLLTGHLRCCQAVALGMGIVLAVHTGLILLQLAWVVRHILAVRRERREVEGADPTSQELMHQLGMEAVHAMAAVILLCGVAMSVCFTACFGYIFTQEGLWTYPQEVRADLRQLEEGRLEELEVWLHPKSRPASLPGPYAAVKNQDSPITRFYAIGEETGYEWVAIYVPDGLDFSPDPDRPFDETRNAAWNWEHARRYQIRYTAHLRLAAEVTPIT